MTITYDFFHTASVGSPAKRILSWRLGRRLSIVIAGSGDAQVYALENLSVKIAGSGDIGYIGDSKIRNTIAGSGEISRIAGTGSETIVAHEVED